VAQTEHAPSVHVRRDGDGAATGGMVISNDDRILAQPVGWQEMAARESEFGQAERQRLLYVAATRAKQELIVSRLDLQLKTKAAEDKSFWSPLAGALASHAAPMTLPLDEPAGRRQPAETAEQVRTQCEALAERRTLAAAAGVRLTSVTRTLREQREDERMDGRHRRTAGASWGRLVHRALEAMGRGRYGVSLERFVRALVRDEQPGATMLELEATVLRVLAQAERVSRDDAWTRLAGATKRAFELPVFTVDGTDGIDVVTQGIADAAALVDGEWVVLDWKTDHADDATWAHREKEYRRQVDAYARMIGARAGVLARGEIIRVKES
jgi:ATP-dependent helicase/nuclease subunit A